MEKEESFQQRMEKRLDEILTGIRDGDFNDISKVPEKYVYDHLLALYLFRNSIEEGDELYKLMYRLAMSYSMSCVRSRFMSKQKISVVIEVISASQWACEDIYRILSDDPRTDVSILVLPQTGLPGDDTVKRYLKCCNFFSKNGYNVCGGMDTETGHVFSFDELGGFPDVVIHSSPWFESFPQELVITALPLSTVNIAVNYGICVADNADGTYLSKTQFNKPMHNMVWRCYANDMYEMACYIEYQFLKGENVRYAGYAKMDRMYGSVRYSDHDLSEMWRIPEDETHDDYKRIIYAPHFTVLGHGAIHYSTFHMNMYFMLYLARKYSDRISFVFKPHPNLRSAVVTAGLFASVEDYDRYVDEWNNLPNAYMMVESDYIDLFKSSDGMIMDSGSFIGEYLYVNKPVLYLRRPEQAFNKLGQEIMDTYYTIDGSDYTGIENWIEDVILGGNDTLAADRQKVFTENLDYYSVNGRFASELVCDDIFSLIS